MNIGYEEDELRPYIEPSKENWEQRRIDILTQMGYSRSQVSESLQNEKFDDIYATYLLLGERRAEVSGEDSKICQCRIRS